MNIPNIPIELVIAVLFFVLPALGSLQKWRRERSGNDPKDARASRSERRPTVEAPQPLPTLTRADTSTSTPATPSRAEGWLEEAQRRVREARQEEADAKGRRGVNPRTLPQTPVPKPAGRTPPARTPQPARPAQRPVQTRTPPTSLEGRTLEGRSLETTRPENAGLKTLYGDASVDTAPPMRVQRLGRHRRATIRAHELRFDERSLVTGFIWHQVLSPPLSKSRRTRLSRRQP